MFNSKYVVAFVLVLCALPVKAEIVLLNVAISGGFAGNGVVPGSFSGSGTGSYNSDTGEFRWSHTVRSFSPYTDFTMDVEESLNRSVNPFTVTSRTTNCYNDVGYYKQCGSISTTAKEVPITILDLNPDGSGIIRTYYEAASNGYIVQTTSIREFTVASVPVPAAAWLFGSALLAMVGFKRKK